MEYKGKALAADEVGPHGPKPPGLASVHVRVVITWLVIFPLAAIGMTILAALAPQWPAVLRAFTLTLVVVPIAVYFAVPGLLLLHARWRASAAEAKSSF